MDLATLHSYWTVLILVVFIGIVYWAFSGKRRQYFEDLGHMPLEDDSDVMQHNSPKEQNHG